MTIYFVFPDAPSVPERGVVPKRSRCGVPVSLPPASRQRSSTDHSVPQERHEERVASLVWR